MKTFDAINNLTGFAEGDQFTSEAQVRGYFTRTNIMQMFDLCLGQTPNQDELNGYADLVIAHKWHCAF